MNLNLNLKFFQLNQTNETAATDNMDDLKGLESSTGTETSVDDETMIETVCILWPMINIILIRVVSHFFEAIITFYCFFTTRTRPISPKSADIHVNYAITVFPRCLTTIDVHLYMLK